jgi:amino acid transporter
VYLAVVSIAIFVCTLAIQAAGIRLIFSMSRDGRLPGSRIWSYVYPNLGTPIWACLVAGALAALPLVVSQQVGLLAIGATGLIYLSYLLTNVVVLQARRRGWPTKQAAFNLGRWAVPLNVAGLLYGASMLINFAWPRPASNPAFNTVATWAASWPVIGGAPLFELYVVLLVIVGGAYWYGVQRHRADTSQIEAPAPEPSPFTIGGP